MVENPNPGLQAAGQISADGQFRWDGRQWVPLAAGFRQPTPWTRPMQMAAAALFAVSAVAEVAEAFLFVNHDSELRALHAQGVTIPQGTDVNTFVNITVAVTIGIYVFIALLELFAALGSWLGWRWMFWAAFILFGLGGLGALTNLAAFAKPDASAIPVGGLVINELFSVASITIFVWMVIGLAKFGPWAMRKPV